MKTEQKSERIVPNLTILRFAICVGVYLPCLFCVHENTNTLAKNMTFNADANQIANRQGAAKGGERPPAWTDGLKQLYDSVVDEPLPDAFMDLLDQFDDNEDTAQSSDGKGAA